MVILVPSVKTPDEPDGNGDCDGFYDDYDGSVLEEEEVNGDGRGAPK